MMRAQRMQMRELSEAIANRVQEYIGEMNSWDGEVFLWIDGNSLDVKLGLAEEEFFGEKCPILTFIYEDVDGSLSPDFDKIDDYAAGWFDLRQG